MPADRTPETGPAPSLRDRIADVLTEMALRTVPSRLAEHADYASAVRQVELTRADAVLAALAEHSPGDIAPAELAQWEELLAQDPDCPGCREVQHGITRHLIAAYRDLSATAAVQVHTLTERVRAAEAQVGEQAAAQFATVWRTEVERLTQERNRLAATVQRVEAVRAAWERQTADPAAYPTAGARAHAAALAAAHLPALARALDGGEPGE